jgi:hypothetical protein
MTGARFLVVLHAICGIFKGLAIEILLRGIGVDLEVHGSDVGLVNGIHRLNFGALLGLLVQIYH